jgi:hypothetical protein|uniref:MD-2-related lipid-recognition domain-containing protein n=1 Tax=viral metagenome TaxID=1070528 RepID=A0A6C0DJ90_9ZZZZ
MNLLALLAAAYSLGSVNDCSNGESKIKINSMSFLPDPPVKGQNSTLNLALMNPSDILAGSAIYSFTYNFIPLAPETKDLCGEVPGGCPIQAGPLDLTSSYPIDTSLSGTIVAKIQWKDTANLQLLCVSITMKV